jgi:transcriptional regulator NrdR family protein
MKCYKCGKDEFKDVRVRENADFKDIKELEYLFNVKECANCHTKFSTPFLKKAKLIAITDAYKSAKGLYTSKDVESGEVLT